MATYYVSVADGSDSNTGLTSTPGASGPWQTVGKVNGFSFSAGDIILFKRGETFPARLRPTVSGSTGNHITFDAYSSGAAPIINGGVSNGCELNNLHDITLQNLYLTTTSDAYALQIEPGYNIDITDCELVGRIVPLRVAGAASATHDLNFLRVITRNATHSGMEVTHTSYPGPSNLTFIQCESYLNGTDSSLHQGFYIQNCDDVLIYRCIAHDNAAHGFQTVVNCTNLTLRRCRSYTNGGHGIELYTLDIGAGIVIDHNLVHGNTRNGVRISDDCLGVSLLNNTFVNNGLNGTNHNITFSGVGTSGNILKNNLSVYDEAIVGGGKWAIYVPDTDTLSDNTLDNNCYIVLNGSNAGQTIASVDTSLATWQSNGADANGLNADPLLVSSSDFHLQSGSPCINAGADVGLSEDFDGNPSVGVPDIGAFESGVLQPTHTMGYRAF
jgi:hypothetical protein